MFQYKTSGTCSSAITFDVKDNKLVSVQFTGGCNGNLQGISKLVEGMDIDEVISRLEGIRCGYKPTSCPDQLAAALKTYKEKFSN
ncbi:MAG: TIGR03905 family TSCPD domain-containing protein [Lachnospiraceae bacterium]|nr:TIGR03905 family TSCPD domain-containing protein [Lachnospiraceae bacterium]MDY4970715.1 TIGR03905 family TSCPD domain-containing protein [Lachnospiraceae bacterium]